MQNVLLDFELSDEQIRALSIHAKFKDAGVYEYLENLPDQCEKIQIWFQIGYNDYTWDVDSVYADLIDASNQVIGKRKLSACDIELSEYSGDEYQMKSFTISKQMVEY